MSVRIYLDTNIFIEAFEKRGEKSEYARSILGLVRNGSAIGIISELIVAELLVGPLAAGDHEMIEAYTALLNSPSGYEAWPMDWTVLIEAARQRARRKTTKMPDAIHLATAQMRNCAAFVTNDGKLGAQDDLTCIDLDSNATNKILALA